MSRTNARLASHISWFSRKTGPLGEHVDRSLSTHYFYNKSKTTIRYCANGKWSGWDSTPMEVHLRTFQVLSSQFAKDNAQVYFKARPVSAFDCDVDSFQAIDQKGFDHLALDKNRVYSFKDPDHPTVIEGAQPRSFFPFTSYWAKDEATYFYNEKRAEVDYRSFRLLTYSFGMDKNKGYFFGNGHLSSFEAHIETLSKLTPNYAFDDQQVYYVQHEDKPNLLSIPYRPDELILALDDQYIRVGRNIYYNGAPIEGADPLSFKALKDSYAKDAKQVYWMGLTLRRADPLSFRYNETHKRFEDNTYLYHSDKAYPKTAF